MKKEERILETHILSRNLKRSKRRKAILDIFLRIDRHVTAEELCAAVKKAHPAIGYTTVYRTLKLLGECGLCRELKFEDGTTRYEHLYDHRHHDHLICTECGRLVEVVEKDIERLQEKLFRRYGFYPQRHRMELYGVCSHCKK